MASFLTSNDLNAELENIFEQADQQLILISPYIKLHERFISVLKTKIGNAGLQIIIVFGKNESDLSRSMKQEDFNFFKEFPNIEIRYEKRLHAKYYANENSAILTSMNLYDYSQDNNIEAGVMIQAKGILSGSNSFENQTSGYFDRIIEQSELLFQRVPEFEKTLLGLSKRYTGSKTEKDQLSAFFNNKLSKENTSQKERFANDKPVKQEFAKQQTANGLGYCIRTGVQIPFNQLHPMCDAAYQSWKKFSNKDYPEKFCHFSGEASNEETSYARPILRKNWAKAKAAHNL